MRSQRQGGRICRLYVQQVFRLWIGRTSFPSPTGLTFSLPVGLAFYCVCEKITCRFSPESWRIAAFALVYSILVRKRGIAGRVHVNVRKVRVNVAWRTWWFVCLFVVHMAADSDEIDPDFVRIDSQVTNRRNRTASCAGGSRHARWVEGGERPAHCPASGSSSSPTGPSSIRSLRFTRHMSTPVMAMITSVAEKISGVRNEL